MKTLEWILTMLEVVMLVEQTLQVSIDNEELRDLRTVGDVKAYLNAKAMGVEPPKRSKTFRIEEVASLMPHKEPFLFLEVLLLKEKKFVVITKSPVMNIFGGTFQETDNFPCIDHD